MQIVPIDGLGILVLGPAQETPVEVWHETLVTLTRLPHGRCLIPMHAGPVSVRRGEQIMVQAVIDPERVPSLGAGRFVLEGPGTLHVWPFVPEPDVGVLAGEAPAASAHHRIDLARRAMPHQVMTLAVQVRDGAKQGPVRFFTFRPDARACPLTIDHASGHNGPITRLQLDPMGLERVELEVVRNIRQTGQRREHRYDVHSMQDVVQFEDLLHDDVLEVTAAPPFALAGVDGRAVQARRYRYRAVPEPRLEPVPPETPLQTRGGLAAQPADSAPTVLRAITPPAPTWRQEWPVAGAGDHPSLVAALQHKIATADSELAAELREDPAALAWWLAVVEAHQDPAEAALVLRHRVAAAPRDVDRAARALRFLIDFPAHIYAELDADGPADVLLGFQERLGMAQQNAVEILRLDAAARQALQAAVQAWQADLAKAQVDWVDGSLAPLDRASGTDELAARLIDDPATALADLWERRARIWQTVPAEARPPVDQRARRTLVGWHIQNAQRELNEAGHAIAACGADMPTVQASDIHDLARLIGSSLRASEPALARLRFVPLAGSRLVEDAAASARRLEAVGAWTHQRIPAAVRTQAERLLARWDDDLLRRAAAWSAFVEGSERLAAELKALERAGGSQAERAGVLRPRLQRARVDLDTVAFADMQPELRSLEDALETQRAVWGRMVADCSASTRDALGLDGVAAWDDVRMRVTADMQAMVDIAQRIEALDRRRARTVAAMVAVGGPLAQAADVMRHASAGTRSAQALLAYDRARQDAAAAWGGNDALAALTSMQLELVRHDLDRRLDDLMPGDDACLAALAAYSDIEGASELRMVARGIELDLHEGAAHRLQSLLARAEACSDTWERIRDRVRARLRPAQQELARYLGTHAPRWSLLDDPDHAIHWLHAMSNGRRDERTGTDPATLAPGNRRLLEHALQEKGLWMP